MMSAAGDDALRARCEREVEAAMARVADDPEARYARRVAFYRRWGAGNALVPTGFGRSELAFMRWAIDRGLLHPLGHPTRPGSPYWRATNGAILADSELAAALFTRGVVAREEPLAAWCAYFERPSAEAWYRAHTGSLVRAMARHSDAGAVESAWEQRFINIALLRLLDAEVMVRGGVWGDLGRLLADPRLPGVRVVVARPWLYPREYPLTRPVTEGGVAWAVRALEQALRSGIENPAVAEEVVRGYLAHLTSETAGSALRRAFIRGEPVYRPTARPRGETAR